MKLTTYEEKLNYFNQFLKANFAYDQFYANLKRKDVFLEEYFDNAIYYKNTITRAFVWVSTPEGSDFWMDLHNKFHNCVSKDFIVPTIEDSDKFWND